MAKTSLGAPPRSWASEPGSVPVGAVKSSGGEQQGPWHVLDLRRLGRVFGTVDGELVCGSGGLPVAGGGWPDGEGGGAAALLSRSASMAHGVKFIARLVLTSIDSTGSLATAFPTLSTTKASMGQ